MFGRYLISVLVATILSISSLSCEENDENQQIEVLRTITSEYLSNHPRYSNKFKIEKIPNKLIIQIEDQCEKCSQILERIGTSSIVFANKEAFLKTKNDTLAIWINSSYYNKKENGESLKYYETYYFTRPVIERIEQLYFINQINDFVMYLDRNIRNETALEIDQASFALNSKYNFYDYEGGGLQLVYDYVLAKNTKNISDEGIAILEQKVKVLYNILKQTNVKSYKYMDSIATIIELDTIATEWNKLK